MFNSAVYNKILYNGTARETTYTTDVPDVGQVIKVFAKQLIETPKIVVGAEAVAVSSGSDGHRITGGVERYTANLYKIHDASVLSGVFELEEPGFLITENGEYISYG